MGVPENQEGGGGGVLLSEIGRLEEVQHGGQGMRRPSLSSTMSDESIGTSLTSNHSSTGSVASDSDIVSNGDGGGRGVGGMESAGGAAAGGRHLPGAPESGTKRPMTEQERVVEQQQSSGQQLRKACDLCTKVRHAFETHCGASA